MADRFALTRRALQSMQSPDANRSLARTLPESIARSGSRSIVRFEPSPAGLVAAGISVAVVLRFVFRFLRQWQAVRTGTCVQRGSEPRVTGNHEPPEGANPSCSS